MFDLFLIKVKGGVGSACVEFDLAPKADIELLLDIEQIVLIGVSADKLIDKRAVELMVIFLGGVPGPGID
jgi:hypothetical protein